MCVFVCECLFVCACESPFMQMHLKASVSKVNTGCVAWDSMVPSQTINTQIIEFDNIYAERTKNNVKTISCMNDGSCLR